MYKYTVSIIDTLYLLSQNYNDLSNIDNSINQINSGLSDLANFKVASFSNNENYLNDPTLLFGTDSYTAYIMIINSSSSSFMLGGGYSMVIGYTYPNALYGAQLWIKIDGNCKYRYNYNGWSEWVSLK